MCWIACDAAEAILLGFQHYLVMLGTTVIIPTALVPQMGGNNVRIQLLLIQVDFVS
jgi:xanthine/uracil permease